MGLRDAIDVLQRHSGLPAQIPASYAGVGNTDFLQAISLVHIRVTGGARQRLTAEPALRGAETRTGAARARLLYPRGPVAAATRLFTTTPAASGNSRSSFPGLDPRYGGNS
jgi:hypothetical protein